jgi:hypothetical protein
MRALITMLVVFLAASSLSAQQAEAGREAAMDRAKAAIALPEKERDLTNADQTVSVVIGAVGLVAAVVAAPYVLSYGGSTQIGPFKSPYWVLDGAAALIGLAALNYTYNQIYHIDPDRSLISLFGIAIGRF